MRSLRPPWQIIYRVAERREDLRVVRRSSNRSKEETAQALSAFSFDMELLALGQRNRAYSYGQPAAGAPDPGTGDAGATVRGGVI